MTIGVICGHNTAKGEAMTKFNSKLLIIAALFINQGLRAESKQQLFSLSEVDAALNIGGSPIQIGLPGLGNGNQKDTEMNHDCHALSEFNNANVCVSTTVGSESQDVIYFLHGAFGDEHEWTAGMNVDLRTAIRNHWQEMGIDAPTVISISFGKTWMLNDLDNSLETFAQKIIPQVENSIFPNGLQGKRILFGISMGGYNASQLYLKHPELWSRAVMIAPMMPLCNPYQSDVEIFKFIKADRTKKNTLLTQLSHYLVKKSFPTEEAWLEHSPVAIGPKYLNPKLPDLLMSTGDHDDFGFFTKNKEFAEIARQRGTFITWLPTDGKHARYDAIAVSEFLLK